MDGIREDAMPIKESPNSNFKVRALDDNGKSCSVPFDKIVSAPQENDLKDFWEDGTIKKKRYYQGEWIEVGIEWEV